MEFVFRNGENNDLTGSFMLIDAAATGGSTYNSDTSKSFIVNTNEDTERNKMYFTMKSIYLGGVNSIRSVRAFIQEL